MHTGFRMLPSILFGCPADQASIKQFDKINVGLTLSACALQTDLSWCDGDGCTLTHDAIDGVSFPSSPYFSSPPIDFPFGDSPLGDFAGASWTQTSASNNLGGERSP